MCEHAAGNGKGEYGTGAKRAPRGCSRGAQVRPSLAGAQETNRGTRLTAARRAIGIVDDEDANDSELTSRR